MEFISQYPQMTVWIMTGLISIIGFMIAVCLTIGAYIFNKSVDRFEKATENLDHMLENFKLEATARLHEGDIRMDGLDVRVTAQEATCNAHKEERRLNFFDRRHPEARNGAHEYAI